MLIVVPQYFYQRMLGSLGHIAIIGAFPPEAYLIFVTTITTSCCVKKLAKCKIFQLERAKCLTHSVKVHTQCKILRTVLS